MSEKPAGNYSHHNDQFHWILSELGDVKWNKIIIYLHTFI